METKAVEQINDMLNQQTVAFEEGLNAVIKGALEAEYHPSAIAAGCASSLARILIAIFSDQGRELQGEAKELALGMFSDVYDTMVEIIAEAKVAV